MEVRQAVTRREQTEAGRVTVEAYQEFAGKFVPSEWDFYARTLPEVQTRIEQGELLIAVDAAGEVVGTVTFYPEPTATSTHWRPDDATFRFLAVRPGYRQRGVGKSLLQECIDRALALGKNRLAMQTTPHMTAAIDMYRKAGFVRDIYGDQTHGSFSLLGYALVLNNRTVPPAPLEEPAGIG
jgi:ribosomal protein S18 acetylase RimI-like enzyme